mgnify:CR=1 FL=1
MIKVAPHLTAILAAMTLHAEELPPILINGYAEFGPEQSRAEACDQALNDAKYSALRKQYGEEFGQNAVLACDDSIQRETGNDCEIFESTWSLLNANGFIKEIRQVEAPTITQKLGLSVCKVTAYITIEEYEGKPDLSFETQLKVLQGTNLRLTDKPVLEIVSNKPGFHYVYHWAPFVDPKNYHKLFPNALDIQTEKTNRLRIPTGNATQNYNFHLSLPEDTQVSNEYLILISSKAPIDAPPDRIREATFFRWLKSFDRDQWTQSTFSYRVLGEPELDHSGLK